MKAYILSLTEEAHLEKQWDFGFVKDFLTGKLWRTPDWVDFDIQNTSRLVKTDRAIVCIAARHHKGLEDKVNKELKKINRVVLFLLGDEEADFDIEAIDHKNIAIWVQNPHPLRHDNYNRLGTGYPQHIHENIPDYNKKDYELVFSGQITHQRRRELVEAIKYSDLYEYVLKETEGFTAGLEPKEYYDLMSRARLAPAPSGAVIPDSFRLFEALEMMAVPIADQKTPDGEVLEYWDWLFNEITPFPKVDNWFALQDIAYDNRANYPQNIHKQTEWWIKWKRKFAYKVMEQLYA